MEKFLLPPRVFLPALAVWLFFSSVTTYFDLHEHANQTEMTEETFKLPAPVPAGPLSLEEALASRRSVRSYRDEPLQLPWVGQILWAAQGITLDTRGYRTAPSAGATFPLEVYLVAGRVDGLEPGLYRYVPAGHLLAKVLDGDLRNELAGAALGQSQVAGAPAVFVIAADYGRTSPRYGDRAVRYVHMEAGHAGQNISLQALAYGLGTVMVGAFSDENVKSLLRLPANEDPLYIIPVGKPE